MSCVVKGPLPTGGLKSYWNGLRVCEREREGLGEGGEEIHLYPSIEIYAKCEIYDEVFWFIFFSFVCANTRNRKFVDKQNTHDVNIRAQQNKKCYFHVVQYSQICFESDF